MNRPAVIPQRRMIESVAAWISATLAACTLWFVVLSLSFPVLPPGSTPFTYYDDVADRCGTVLRARDDTTGCADAVSDQRWLIIALAVVVAASLGVFVRYGPRSLRAAQRKSTIVVAVCFTIAAVALTGVIAVSSHYTPFSYGDSAWTDALHYNSLHRTAYVSGLVLLIFTLPIGLILGAARLMLTPDPPPSRR